MQVGGGPILVVDADARFRAFVSSLVEGAGFRARAARLGQEAVKAAREERPGLVILDIDLPDVSGFEVCQQLRDEFGDDLPIIFVSADRTQPVDRAAGLLLGGDDYLVKPVNRDELLARSRRLLSRSRTGRGLPRRKPVDAALTHRELQVLELLAEGLGSKEIATRLFISPKTVASHLQRVLSKLGARTRAEAVAVAYREGFVAGSNDDVRAHSGVSAA